MIEDASAFVIECMVPNGLKQSDIAPLNRLLAEFSPHSQPLSFSDWQDIVLKNHLFVALNSGRAIVGMATLVINYIPTGKFGLVEDVIVTAKFQGNHVGTKLMQALIETARTHGLKQIDLTSRRKRQAANHLYQKLGFEYRDTNNYRLTL